MKWGVDNMFKRIKFLLALFMSVIVLLAGCGTSSVPYKEGDTYKDNQDNFVKITNENEWQVKGYRNHEALYKVEPMEYKGGSYSVVSISLKEKMTKKDPWLILNEFEYYILAPTEKGFSAVYIGTSNSNDTKWKEFENELENVKDKEAFLKKEFESGKKTSKKFEKTN